MGMLADVELRELRIFLTLAEELHFGRTAERLGVSQPSVSESIRLLERRIGTRLFERTSRSVWLTPAGNGLRQRLTTAVETLDRALAETHAAVNGVSGVLRIATTELTFLPPLVRLISAFESAYPSCATEIVEVAYTSLYSLLRRGQADVLVNWLAVDEPDLTAGPAIACYDRVLAVAHHHRLAGRESVSAEELADELVDCPSTPLPTALLDAIIPPRTPSGRTIKRTPTGPSLTQSLAEIALGRVVHPTMQGVVQLERHDIVLVPIHDLPPLPLGLIWRTATANARIRALAEMARREGPWPATADTDVKKRGADHAG